MKYVEIARRYIPLDRPWVLGAWALALIVAVYSGVVGVQYVSAMGQINATSEAIQDLRMTAPREMPHEVELEAELAETQAELDSLLALYEYPESDDLVGILSATAKKAGVWVERASIGDRQREEQNGVSYKVQSINVSIRGTVTDTYAFFALLHETVPMVDVRRVSIGSVRSNPTTQANLLFYLFPEQSAN